MGEEDFLSEAWEAVYRIKYRYRHLEEPHFGNVLIRGVRNALINARKRIDRELNRTISLDHSWPDLRDHYEEVTLRIALAQAGRRVVRFHGEAARCQGETRDLGPTGEAFNLHAGQAVRAGDRAALGRLARFILRPVLGRARLSRRSDGGGRRLLWTCLADRCAIARPPGP